MNWHIAKAIRLGILQARIQSEALNQFVKHKISAMDLLVIASSMSQILEALPTPIEKDMFVKAYNREADKLDVV